MRLRYRLEVVTWCCALFLLGSVSNHAIERNHDLITSLLALVVAFATIQCLLEVTLREAVADAICRSLNGKPMSPRAPR